MINSQATQNQNFHYAKRCQGPANAHRNHTSIESQLRLTGAVHPHITTSAPPRGRSHQLQPRHFFDHFIHTNTNMRSPRLLYRHRIGGGGDISRAALHLVMRLTIFLKPDLCAPALLACSSGHPLRTSPLVTTHETDYCQIASTFDTAESSDEEQTSSPEEIDAHTTVASSASTQGSLADACCHSFRSFHPACLRIQFLLDYFGCSPFLLNGLHL